MGRDRGQHSDTGGDQLRRLRAFCHAARLGSISAAAEYVMSSQPSVSQQVRTLEEELAVALFERRGPRIRLTRAGEMLYARAMPLVEGIDRLPETFAERHHGVVSDALAIGAGQTSAAYLLPEYLKRFRERWPAIGVEVRTGTGEQRLKWLRDYELDLIIGSMDIVPPDVDFHQVRVSQFVVITASDHPLAGRESVRIEEMATYPFVGHSATRYVTQVAEILLRLRGVELDVALEVDGWNSIANHVGAGVGISVVPDLCLREHDGLRRIAIADASLPPRRYGVMTRRDGILSSAARQFLSVMAPGGRETA